MSLILQAVAAHAAAGEEADRPVDGQGADGDGVRRYGLEDE
jgi:hypothetical protein